MKNNFPVLLNSFFKALENEFNYSNNTIISYKYTFNKIFIKYHKIYIYFTTIFAKNQLIRNYL